MPELELKDVQETEGRSSSRRRATRLPVAAALVVLLGLVLAVPLNSFRSLQVIGADFRPIDGSWAVDLPDGLIETLVTMLGVWLVLRLTGAPAGVVAPGRVVDGDRAGLPADAEKRTYG